MAIIKWSPFSDLDDFFDSSIRPMISRRMMPAVDAYEKDDNIIVKSTVSGLKPEDIDIIVGDDYVEISGERKEEEEERKADFFRKEISIGSFLRRIKLSSPVDKNMAESYYENGILTITIPKTKEAKEAVRKIKPRIK